MSLRDRIGVDLGRKLSVEDGIEWAAEHDVVYLDVRSDGEWEGTNDRGNKRAGRIPGAVHLEWLNFITARCGCQGQTPFFSDLE